MESILKQIKQGLEHKLYYLSLFITLCIPDICGALESEKGEANREKLKNWINNNLVPYRPDKYGERFTSDHIYQFRCAMLHQGRTKHVSSEYLRILFFEPGIETGIHGLHCCIVGSDSRFKSLLIDIDQFCNDMIESAKVWINKNKMNKNYLENYKKLIRRYPNGVKPVIGYPVIG